MIKLFIANSYAAEDGSATCTLTATNVTFTAYNPYDATIEKANGTVKVVCKNTTDQKSLSYVVTLSPGSSGNQSSRLAKNGTNSVMYNLFKNSTFTQILGDGNSSTFTLSKAATLAASGTTTDNYTVYGRVPAGQPLSKPMTYTDALTVTLTYTY